MNDKKYKIILVVLVLFLLILIGLLIYTTKKSNNNSNSTTTTTTTTTTKNLAKNFNMFPLNDDSDVIHLSVGDLYEADVDTDADYTPDHEVVSDGYFHESGAEFRSAPYFDVQIDGITLLDTAF